MAQITRQQIEHMLKTVGKDGLSLSKQNLTGIDLSHLDLSGVRMHEANFQEANLSHTNLSGAYLYDANFKGANLSYANLSRAHISKVNFSGANLTNASLEDAQADESTFEQADLQAARLLRTSLRAANFTRARLRFAEMMGANCAPLSVGDDGYNYALFVDADLTEANLSSAWLGGAQLQGADFSGANLQGCNLQNAHYSAKTVWDAAFNPKIAGAVWRASDIIPVGPFACIYYGLIVPLLGFAAYKYADGGAAVLVVLGAVFGLSWLVYGVVALINKIASKR